MLSDFKHLADTTDTASTAARAKFEIPAVDSSQVTLVASDSICTRARQALDSLIHATSPNALNPLPIRSLYVIRIGTVTAVRDPGSLAKEYSPVDFFDEHWAFLSTMMAY
jgi:hypothetical protein